MKALVTGGAGFVGSHLVDKLLLLDCEVDIVDDLSTGSRQNVNPNAKFYQFEVEKLQQCRDVWDCKYDIIFHLAAKARIQPSFSDPVLYHETNLTGTICVLELARYLHSRVVYPGSSSVLHDVYSNPYTFTKQMAEDYCRMYNKVYGISTVISRFFNVYGPRQIETGDYSTVLGVFEKQFRQGSPLTITGTGEQRRDFTHVDDIVNGLVMLSEKSWNGELFNFGTGTNYSINEIANMFGSPKVYLPARPGEAEQVLADISETRKILGWEPRHNLPGYIEKIKEMSTCIQ